ncbi:MAG: bifunctional 5,10-methylenetetrahydrofolate dehydrogenase/5,10-methenyltetrahydrofolate cyclohydrolase [bacterium]|nr:bifunctional 5,10-methylenetetrahydrofolate dehydrogenase/5,10-methenyltetrahydrofolate cyclohydrolase [bacterium]
MIIDGKKLAEEIKTSLKDEVLNIGKKIRLAVIQVGNDPVALKFLEQKKKFGNAVGCDVRIYNLPMEISTNQLRKKVSEIVHIKENTGVIIQLPLPKEINTQYILDAITSEKDPDMLSSKSVGAFSTGRSKILPPVVGAIDHIFMAYGIQLKAKKVVVLGAGRLVGRPVAAWLTQQGSSVTIIDENTPDPRPYTQNADIIVSGVGIPHFIKQDMVKEGTVVIDCGTSTGSSDVGSERALRGDVDPSVAGKASLFTPVPGGVGPLTVAMLFKNLVELAKR